MEQITRYFTQNRPTLKASSKQPEGEIDMFFHHHVFVLLGEPGLGKTTAFRYAAKREKDAEFIRIGEFLSLTSLENLRNKVLYLDGLDEHRSRANGMDVMDAIIVRLKELNSPKVRISCRTAEWHGGKDLGALSAISNNTSIVELDLNPLTQEDILKLVPNSEKFIEGAKDYGLHEFLNNPQDFFLLNKFYLENNEWPDNRSELMEGACKALMKELNKSHYDAVDDWVTDRDLARASEYLALILILSNVTGISSDRTNANREFPSIHEFDGDLYAMKVATGRHIFKPIENKRIEPKHRKIAEYMGARYLASRVREGLSLRRVMALMTGIDGGTPPDLRGLYAWLVTLLSGMGDHVMVHDPYGAIIYGDSYSWTSNTKKRAIILLQKLAEKDPWFREQDRSFHELGGLSDPALVEDFIQILQNDKCQSHLISTILNAIAAGPKLPGMGDALLDFVRSPGKPDHLKNYAIDAFITAVPERVNDLILLINEVRDEKIDDHEQYIYGALLDNLYPETITPDQITDYLIKPSSSFIGSYHMFVSYRLFELTDLEGLRVIARNLVNNNSDLINEEVHPDSSFLSKLISRLVEGYGSVADINELYFWLSMGLNKYESSRIQGEDTKSIRRFLEDHDEIYLNLFFYSLDKHPKDDMNWYQVWWRFRELSIYTTPPSIFSKMLLTQLDEEVDIEKAKVLYELACALIMEVEPSLSLVTMEELESISKSKPEFVDILNRASHCEIQEWRLKDAERKKLRIEERASRQDRNIENLEPHKQAIKDGEALGYLDHFAKVWFGLFSDVDREAKPRERLEQEVGDELAEILVAGFINGMNKPVFNSIEDIAEADSNNQSYNRAHLLLAAMEIIAEGGKDAITSLPNNVLGIAISYNLANSCNWSGLWLSWLIEGKPDIVKNVMEIYWRTQLSKKSDTLTGFYRFNGDEPILEIASEIIPILLSEFPEVKSRILETMLLNAIKYCSHQTLIPLVRSSLKNMFDNKSGIRTMWLSTGFVIDQDSYLYSLKTQLKKNDDEKWFACPFLMATAHSRDADGKFASSVNFRKLTIELLGSVFKNIQLEFSGSVRSVAERDEPEAARGIRRLIHAFSQDPSEQSSLALAQLRKNPKLSHWHTDIIYTIANQVRTAREANFTYPKVAQVVSMLSNAEPANVTDLKALTMDILSEIADEIRHGNTDGYKSFWNVGDHGKAIDIHVDENTARDRLLELLRPKLRHMDIAAEPEVSYADGKRADIAIYCKGMKLPIEIKRDDHSKIWTAAEEQLKKQYSRDPTSEGNGIYLVFWFDGKGMKKPPNNLRKPTNANELKEQLLLTIPESSLGLIEVLVFDVSVPVDKMARGKTVKGVS